MTSSYTKLTIACIWFALIPNYYLWAQGAEIDSQVKRYGLLDQEESDHQRRTMYLPFFGLFFALATWVVALAVYIAAEWPGQGGFTDSRFVMFSAFNTPVFYGAIEWGIFFHTLLVAYQSIDVYYPIISTILGLSGRIRRIEQGTVSVTPPTH